jgi:N6-adenosine-specific RNA methylase IME4
VKGKLRTLQAGRTQVNVISTRKQEHSWKPGEQYGIIEACSPGVSVRRIAFLTAVV